MRKIITGLMATIALMGVAAAPASAHYVDFSRGKTKALAQCNTDVRWGQGGGWHCIYNYATTAGSHSRVYHFLMDYSRCYPSQTRPGQYGRFQYGYYMDHNSYITKTAYEGCF